MMEWKTTSVILDDLADFENRETWNRFAGRFRDPLMRFGRKIGLNVADAEDMAQQTLLVFAEGLRGDRYDRAKGRLSSWLFGIAADQVKIDFAILHIHPRDNHL